MIVHAFSLGVLGDNVHSMLDIIKDLYGVKDCEDDPQ